MVSPKFRALMWKHGIVRRRKCCELLFEILAPITPIIAVYLLCDKVHQRYMKQQTGRMMENDYFRSNPKLIMRASTTIADKMYDETMKMVVGYTFFTGPLIVFAFLMSRLLDERASGIRELIKLSGASSTMINISHFLNALPACVIFCIVTTALVRAGDKPLLPKVHLGLFFCGLLLHFISLLTAAFFFTYISKEAEYSASLVLFVYIAMWVPVRLLNFASNSKIVLVIIGLFPHAPSYWLLEELTADRDIDWDLYNIWESQVKYKSGVKCGCIGAVFIALAVQIILLGFFAWYLDKIRPGLFGVALPWYFIFPKCCQQRLFYANSDHKSYHDDDPDFDKSEYEKFFEPEPLEMYPGIRVESVTKEFYDMQSVYRALTDVSFNVYKGEITVLLGHNGAGKSTIISIITGLMNTTYGEVYINGVNTATKQEVIRKELGLCPQHNLNFPDLNVIEHFVFFTMLKGSDYNESFYHSKVLLSKLKMLPRWNSMPRELSGGVLRRLQLGCALSGKPGVLILDEPTSGLDLQARREMWDILLSLRGSRTILLTTHFMEEADVLADRIIALHAGRLHCHATPSFLKNAFGTGFRLTIKTMGAPNEKTMTQCIKRSVPSARLLDLTPNSLVYDLPINKNLTKLFDKIELRKSSMKIQSLSVGISTSLEDVFMNLCRDVDIANLDESIVGTPPEPFDSFTGLGLTLQRIWALFVRQFDFTTSRCITFLFLQILLPTLMMFALTQLFNDARKANNFSFRSQLPDLDVAEVFGENLTDLMDERKSVPDMLLRTLNIPSNILNNDTLLSQYKEIILGLLRNESLFNYFFNDILKNRNRTVLNKIRKRRAEADTKEFLSINDEDSGDDIIRIDDISNLKKESENYTASLNVDDKDVFNINKDPQVDIKTVEVDLNDLNKLKNKRTVNLLNQDHNRNQNYSKENNTSKLNALENVTNNTVNIINFQDSPKSFNITTINTQNIPSKDNNTVDIYVENTQDLNITNYDPSNLRNAPTTVNAPQVFSDNDNTTDTVVQPSTPRGPVYALNDLNNTDDTVENTQDAVNGPTNITDNKATNNYVTLNYPSITDDNVKNAQNFVDNSNITNNQVENYTHTLIHPNFTDDNTVKNTVNVLYISDNNAKNAVDDVVISDNQEINNLNNHANTTNNVVTNTLYSNMSNSYSRKIKDDLNITYNIGKNTPNALNLNITSENVKNTPYAEDESNIDKGKKTIFALKDLNVTAQNIKDTLEALNACNTSFNNVINITKDRIYENITENKIKNTLNIFNKLDFTNNKIKNTLNSINASSNTNDSVDALNDLQKIYDNVKNTLDALYALNNSYSNVKYSLDTINNDEIKLNFTKTKNAEKNLHTLNTLETTSDKIKNAIKALNFTDTNIANVLYTLNALNVTANKTVNIKNAIRLLDALNVTNTKISNKTELDDVRESLRRSYVQNMQYNINMFLRSLIREGPDNKKTKSLMNCTMFAIFNIFIIITAALNNTALPTRERITIVRHIHLMTGCSSIMYWSVTFIYHMVVYVVFSVLTAVYAVISYERDNTLDNSQFYVAYILVLIFGGMAFHMFAYFTTFFFSEHSVSLLLIVLQMIYGLLFPIFTISVSELISSNSSFNYYVYYYLTEITGAFLPAHSLVTAVLRLTNVARLNRYCELNQKLCPSSIPTPYEVKKFDASFCCSQGKISEGRPFHYFSIFYGAGYYFVTLIFQFALYAFLIIALQNGVFDRWYTRYIKKSLDISPHRFKSDTVEAERSYVDKTYQKLMALPKSPLPLDQLLLHNVTVVYPKSIFTNYLGLNDVSFAVKKGECLGILGVSGAGKTTIFRAIASEKQHMTGNIYVQNYEKNLHGKDYLRAIGYCPQFDGVDYFRTGYSNINTLLMLRGLTYDHLERETWQWLASVGMKKYALKAVSSYSGGMVRRLVTANSLCAGTPISILDEPTTGVDTAARRLVWAAMKRGLFNDRAILFTSHGADELEILSSRILFVGAGEVMVIGTPAALRDEYAPGHTVGLKFNMAEAHTLKGQEDIDKVKKTMKKMFDCTLKEEHMTALIYRINKKMTYSRTFTVLENIKREFHGLLQEFTVSNTDIEDVFFSFKEQYVKRASINSEGGRSNSEPLLPTSNSDPNTLMTYKDETKRTH